ncbi:hypothetical protein ALC57_15633 [Trachymyrmex cornetzi]|uniref:Helix-turn-helix domain-containing protein n=1 Tax=Trachymyrmex cornetzi TaxID=471704 RepID=A0A151IWK4_9HYME|nr:hypothetical protein ALC57_15633 [Trachymyrmex cornetzi]
MSTKRRATLASSQTGTIISFIDKILLLAHPFFQQKNIIEMINIFLNNCYPLSFIFSTIWERIKFHIHNRGSTRNIKVADKYFTIPYVRSISESFLPISSMFHCKLAFTIPNTLKGLIRRGKGKLVQTRSGQKRYKIECENCDASYVGQTKRRLGTRIKEHKSDIRRNTGSPSVITDHRVEFDHNFKWDDVRILDNESSYNKRLLSEMIHIKRQKHGINKMKDTESLPDLYSDIIQSLSPANVFLSYFVLHIVLSYFYCLLLLSIPPLSSFLLVCKLASVARLLVLISFLYCLKN